MNSITAYLKELPLARMVLWCYLIWYMTMAFFYFDSNPRIWITSLGISGIIGIGLMLSVSSALSSNPPNRNPWQVFRLFMMPFCVSSFSSLVKDHGFILVFSPRIHEDAVAISLCAGFLLVIWIIRKFGA